MEIKIISNKRNDLLRRNEVIFMVTHDVAPTPSRSDIREKLANTLQVDVDRVYIRNMRTRTGERITIGEAHVYDTSVQAKIIEPKHTINRNTPQKEEK